MECGGFCENPASSPLMCYLIDFIRRAYTKENKTNFIIFYRKDRVIISKITKFLFRSVIFYGIFWKCNLLILGYFHALRVELSRFPFWTPSGGSHQDCFWISLVLGVSFPFWSPFRGEGRVWGLFEDNPYLSRKILYNKLQIWETGAHQNESLPKKYFIFIQF